jgi:radical SAM superfamily enzyme YgiQ (UPF0313 family)
MGTRRKTEATDSRSLLELETHLVAPSSHGGDLRVHLVYPNSYWVAMSNLGFQAVYRLFAEVPGVVIERGFLPDHPYDEKVFAERWRTFETSRPLADCDIIAFSLSFETDYPHLFRILRNAGILSLDPQERSHKADTEKFNTPLILAGGTSVTLNPEPVADVLDVIMLGEAEEWVPEFTTSLRASRENALSRAQTLAQLTAIEGVYIPRFYRPHYQDSGQVQRFEHEVIEVRSDKVHGADAEPSLSPSTTKLLPAPKASRRFVKDLSKFPTYTGILTPETEFRSMFLTETGRGCEMGCRFCVAGYIYRPVRKRSESSLEETVKIGLESSQAVGFVGASVSSHKAIAKLASKVAESGARASLSSLMSQKVNKVLAASLSESEYKTVALAPEAGSERLRRAAGKRVTNSQVIEAARELAEAGIRGFKLYFIVGLPTETDADVEAIVSLSEEVRRAVVDASRESGKAAWVVLSVNPFIPKANTPFQWEPMLEQKALTEKITLIRNAVKRIPNIELHFEPPKESYFQALLSRGDRRVARLLAAAEYSNKDWKWLLQQGSNRLAPEVPPIDFYATRRFGFDEILPWEIVDSKIERKLLLREAMRAHYGEQYTLEDDGECIEEIERPEVDGTSMLKEGSVLSERLL